VHETKSLIDVLEGFRASRDCGRVFFYFERSAGSMRHGHIGIHSEGRCKLDFEGLSLDQAIEELLRTPIARVVALPNAAMGAAPVAARTVGVDDLIDLLRRSHPKGGEAIGKDERPTPSAVSSSEHPQFRSALASPPTSPASGPSPVALVGATLGVLEEFYGGAATRRVDELVDRYPPDRQPEQFLSAAEQILSGLIGPRKSSAAFEDIRKRLLPGR